MVVIAVQPGLQQVMALLGIALALAFTIVGIIRVEMYHRRLSRPPVPEEDAEWRVEPHR